MRGKEPPDCGGGEGKAGREEDDEEMSALGFGSERPG